jgi:hypothetical protein
MATSLVTACTACSASEPYRGRFLSIASTRGDHRRETVVDRRRWIGAGMREEITVRNFGREPMECTVAVAFAADFADVTATSRLPWMARRDRSTHTPRTWVTA